MKSICYYIILIFLFSKNFAESFAQSYSDLMVKEHCDALFEKAYYGDKWQTQDDLLDYSSCESTAMGDIVGDRLSEVLTALLHLYKTTGDKGYLIKFINITIKAQEKRNDVCGAPDNHPGWVNFAENTNIYRDGNAVAPMAEYVYLVKNNNLLYSTLLPQSNNIITIPTTLTSLTLANIATYGTFAEWLRGKVEETLDYFLGNGFWDNSDGFKHDNGIQPTPIRDEPLAINMQAGFATSILYIGLSGNGSKYIDYRAKAAIIASKYLSTLTFNDICKGQQFVEPVMKLYSDNSYWWYDKTWGKPSGQCVLIQPICFPVGFQNNPPQIIYECSPAVTTTTPDNHDSYIEFIEDISHAISVLRFPLAAYYNYPGSTSFNITEMIRWKNTFSQRIFSGYSGNVPTFNNNVLGNNDKLGGDWQCAPNNCSNNCLKNYALGYMPFYKFDEASGQTPYVYNILMDFYRYDFQQQGLAPSFSCEGPSFQGNQYYGLSEVVSAQWDKECPNLTLYNRDIVYNQDFFAKGDIIVAPAETGDPYYTTEPYADPKIFTDGGSSQRFVIEPGSTVNMRSGGKIILKHGFHAKQGSNFRAYNDPSLSDNCGTGKTARISGDNNGSKNKVYENTAIDNVNPANLAKGKQNLENDITFQSLEALNSSEQAHKTSSENLNSFKIDNNIINQNSSYISVIPNPNRGEFTISLHNSSGVATAIVYSTLNTIVFQSELSTDRPLTVNLFDQPKGIYFLKTQYGNKVTVKKIIVQ